MRRLLPVLVLLTACSTPAKRTPARRDLSRMTLGSEGSQALEGRLAFFENFVVLGRGNTLLKSFEAGVGGRRTHGSGSEGTRITDTLSTVTVTRQFKMPGTATYLKGLTVTQEPESPRGPAQAIPEKGVDAYRLGTMILPLWRFVHALPRDEGGRTPRLVSGYSWTVRENGTRKVQGRVIPVYRKSTYTVASVTHSGQLHFATIKGRFFATSPKPVTMGPFTVEIIGRGEMEAEFSLDRGVFTHVKGREILGWAGTYRKTPSDKPVTTGYRRELSVDLYLTENQ